MKSNDRRDMATNELADVLGRWGGAVKPYVNHILLVIIVVLVLIIVGVKWRDYNKKQQDQAVTGLYQALISGDDLPTAKVSEIYDKKIEALANYLQRFGGKPEAGLAQLALADSYYNRALVAWAEGQDVEAYLSKAEPLYSALAKRKDFEGRRALFGLACIAAQRGQKDEASKQLMALAQANPETQIAYLANDRLEVLKNAKPFDAGKLPSAPKPEPAKTGAAAVAPAATAVTPSAVPAPAASAVPATTTAPAASAATASGVAK